MADGATAARKASLKALPWVMTPILILVLSIGLVMMVYLLMPTHTLQKYLNIAFLDDLKITSTTAGLNIIEKDIQTSGQQQTFDEGEVIYPSFGMQYAKLVCEDIDLTVGVYFGTKKELLALGAGQSTHSAVIGTPGNTVISAHVNTYFADLGKMEVGDIVTLYTEYGVFTYEAAELIRFEKDDKSYVIPTQQDQLTLYTCEADVMGNSDMRIGVVCTLVDRQYYIPAEEKE